MFYTYRLIFLRTTVLLFLCSMIPVLHAQDTEDRFESMRKRMQQLRSGDSEDGGSLLKSAPPGEEEPPVVQKAEEEQEELPGMVYVAAGDFIMGTNKGFAYEFPEHMVYLEGFYIDKYEVTNMQYKRFLDYTGHNPPQDWKKGKYPSGKGSYPVTNISYFDAAAYAEWSGKRLPTEQEWEKAARSTDGRTYPWGNAWEKNYANVSPTLFIGGALKSIGTYPEGRSKYGVYDMCGNVWEWTSSSFMPYPGNDEPNDNYGEKNKVIRGGSYKQSEVMGQTTRRDHVDPNKTKTDIGFRCAK